MVSDSSLQVFFSYGARFLKKNDGTADRGGFEELRYAPLKVITMSALKTLREEHSRSEGLFYGTGVRTHPQFNPLTVMRLFGTEGEPMSAGTMRGEKAYQMLKLVHSGRSLAEQNESCLDGLRGIRYK